MSYYVNIEFAPGIDKLDDAAAFHIAAEAAKRLGHPVCAYYNDHDYYVNIDGAGAKHDGEKFVGIFSGTTYTPYFPSKPEPSAAAKESPEPAQEPWWDTPLTVAGIVVIVAALLWFAVLHFPFPATPETVNYAFDRLDRQIEESQHCIDTSRSALEWAKAQGLIPKRVNCGYFNHCDVETATDIWTLYCDKSNCEIVGHGGLK